MVSITTASTKDPNDNDVAVQEYDILIVGAGISGISAAYYIQRHFPNKSYRILEGRDNVGGTWDFFKYPGIRCDSFMSHFGFSFRPWNSNSYIVGAGAILDYLKDTIEEYDMGRHMEFNTRVQAADWDSQQGQWTLHAIKTCRKKKNNSTPVTYRAPFVFACTGYYSYEKGHTPNFPNQDVFEGPIIHPQHWPQDINYADKKIVVIGSGATAVTLIPALAKTAKHVTMLQRSPTYIAAIPSMATIIPRAIAFLFGYGICRWYCIVEWYLYYWLFRAFPQFTRKLFLKDIERMVGDEQFDPKHYTPRHEPWDERLCLSPDGDFFKTIHDRKADIVTDHIEEFTSNGIRLRDSQEVLQADIIVTATGLQILFGGGMEITVDSQKPIDPGSKFLYKGFMMDDVPNFFLAGGYTNASWTLKVDLTNNAACRLIKAMEQRGAKYFQPEKTPQEHNRLPTLPLLDFQSGYIQRSLHLLPNQSDHMPWRLYMNYFKDKFFLDYMPLENDKNLKYY